MLNTFEVNGDGTISAFSGGIVDPDVTTANLSDEEREVGRQILRDKAAMKAIDASLLDMNVPLDSANVDG